MKTLPTLKESILLLFHHMKLRFDGARFPQLDATYQFIFTDIGEGLPVHIRFSGGKAEHSEGVSGDPSIIIRTPAALWLDISGGIRNPVWALITGKFKVEGRRSLLQLLPRLLTKKVEVPASQDRPGAWSPPSRVLAMIGNPRKQNGLTYFYLQYLLEGMTRAGSTIEEIMLYDKKIGHCLGCFQCWTRTPGRCVQKDDQAGLMEKMNAADLVVYAMPLYYHSMPGLVKDHFDRQLPMVLPWMERAGGITRHPQRKPVEHGIVLFSICGFPELAQFEPLVRTVETYSRMAGTKLAASVLVPGAMKTYYDPTQRTRLLELTERLRTAGEQIVLTGSVERSTLRAIGTIPVPLDKWRSDSNWYWHDQQQRGTGGA